MTVWVPSDFYLPPKICPGSKLITPFQADRQPLKVFWQGWEPGDYLDLLSPCLFNFYAEYIMRNAGLEEAQAGIKTAGRNINNLRYADDITLTA